VRPDTISYFLSELGLFRAGYVPFLISTRNSSAALAHLLSAASVEHLLVSGDPGTMHVVAQALAVVPGLDISSFVSDMPHVTDVLPEGENQSTLYAERNFKLESSVVYIHSSGKGAVLDSQLEF
jgi:acyl-CoA synthetase (AMP-forming)/AMP-acid ligase II